MFFFIFFFYIRNHNNNNDKNENRLLTFFLCGGQALQPNLSSVSRQALVEKGVSKVTFVFYVCKNWILFTHIN